MVEELLWLDNDNHVIVAKVTESSIWPGAIHFEHDQNYALQKGRREPARLVVQLLHSEPTMSSFDPLWVIDAEGDVIQYFPIELKKSPTYSQIILLRHGNPHPVPVVVLQYVDTFLAKKGTTC